MSNRRRTMTSDLVFQAAGGEIINAKFEEVSAFPPEPFRGQLITLTNGDGNSKLFCYNGTTWVSGVTSLNGRQGDLTLDKSDFGLDHVDNLKQQPYSTTLSSLASSLDTLGTIPINRNKDYLIVLKPDSSWKITPWLTSDQIAGLLDFSGATNATHNDIIQNKSGVWVNRSPAQYKVDLGVDSIDNTRDIDKPISLPQAHALDLKADQSNLTAHTVSTTAHGISGSVVGTTDQQTLTNKTLSSPVISAPIGLTATDVGLGSINNTSDMNKPVSTAQAAANLQDRARANHTGSQLAATISDLATAVDARITAQKAVPNGLATLDINGKLSSDQVSAIMITSTSVVDSLASQLALAASTQEGDIVIRSDLPATFVKNSGATGTIQDWTQLATPTDLVLSVNGMTGVVTITAASVGLGNVTNTSDSQKPVSTAQQTAINNAITTAGARANHTGTQLAATISDFPAQVDSRISAMRGVPSGVAPLDSSSLVPIANLPAYPTKSSLGMANVDNTSDSQKPISTATQTALDGKQPLDTDLTQISALVGAESVIIQYKSGTWAVRTPAQFKTDLALIKSDVGLGNVDNTSDVNKPVSTATSAAITAAIAARRWVGYLPAMANNANTVLTHNLGTQDILVEFIDANTKDVVRFDWNATSSNTITVHTDVAIAANQVRIIIHS